jgi:hypothetical protein
VNGFSAREPAELSGSSQKKLRHDRNEAKTRGSYLVALYRKMALANCIKFTTVRYSVNWREYLRGVGRFIHQLTATHAIEAKGHPLVFLRFKLGL